MIEPALALLEFSSIAAGIQAADAMVKRAQIDVIRAGTVQPGKYLVLIGGEVADVEESLAAGREVGGATAIDVGRVTVKGDIGERRPAVLGAVHPPTEIISIVAAQGRVHKPWAAGPQKDASTIDGIVTIERQVG